VAPLLASLGVIAADHIGFEPAGWVAQVAALEHQFNMKV
jgi:hypothetical protein